MSEAQAPEPRTRAKLVRYAPSEIALVAERSRLAGRPVACFIREVSLGAPIRVASRAKNEELIRRLALLGNQLVALARLAHDKQLDGALAFDAAAAELVEVIRRLD